MQVEGVGHCSRCGHRGNRNAVFCTRCGSELSSQREVSTAETLNSQSAESSIAQGNAKFIYQGFISYSHSADGRLAPAVQQALHKLAKPWYRLRLIHVFRDQTSLSANPALWPAIERALAESEYFLLMASPEAANSNWVRQEINWWLTNRPINRLLIILTDGEAKWADTERDFDWKATTALPNNLRGRFSDEPLYVDFRWARDQDHLSLRHSQFRAAILDIAAPLHGKPKDELDGEDVRQYRRARLLARSGISVLVLLFVIALLAAYLATQETKLATSRALGARSEAVLPTNPELAMLLSRQAVGTTPDEQAEYALRLAFTRNPQRIIHVLQRGNLVGKFVGSDVLAVAKPGEPPSLWNVATGRQVGKLATAIGDQISLSASAAQALVVIQSDKPRFVLYDGKSWTLVSELQGSRARFSRDGQVLTATGADKILQWSVPSLQARTPVALPKGFSMRDVSVDGSLLLLTEGEANEENQSEAYIVQAESGRILATLPKRLFREGSGFSPDGRLLITESLNASFDVWDARTGRRLRELEKKDDIGWTTQVAYSPDSRMFVTGNRSGMLHMWDINTGKLIGTRSNHRNWVFKVEFSPDGKVMLSVGADGAALLWDTDSLRCLVTLGGRGDDAWDVGFAPDSMHFLTTHLDGTVRVWDRRVWYPAASIRADTAVVSADGRLVAGSNESGRLRLWNPETGNTVGMLNATKDDDKLLAVSLRASLTATAPTGGGVWLWNMQTGKFSLRIVKSLSKISALAFNADGTVLATGSDDGEVRFWNTHDGSALNGWQASQSKISRLVIHPDGKRVLVGSFDGSAKMRDIKSGEVLLEANVFEEGAVIDGLALNAPGELLVLTGDKFPQIWDLQGRYRVQTLPGHSDDVLSAGFSLDSRWIVTGSGYQMASGEPPEDGNAVRLWDETSGRILLTYLSANLPIKAVSFGRDETTIFAFSEDGWVRQYYCETCSPLPALVGIASARASRQLTQQEYKQYVPGNAMLRSILKWVPIISHN
jgi:WD40 repeat protein